MDNKVIYLNNLNNDKKHDSNFKSIFLKFMTKKNLKILSLILIAVVSFILFMNLSTDDSKNNTIESVSTSGYLTTLEYCAKLESKLMAVLSNIDGAGQVSVMVNVEGSPELVYATEDDSKVTNNTNGTTSSSSSSPIIVNVGGNSSALILTENLPKVKGVIVVSSGANNIAVKLDMLKAVSTLLGISVDQVSILKGV